MSLRIYSHDSVLGQLQRGRGLGYLGALDYPRSEARRRLLYCILEDPRMDRQCEDRADYYANLALELDLPLDSLGERLRQIRGDEEREDLSSLVGDTLGSLAKRGSGAAAEILLDEVRHACCWDRCLDDLISIGDTEVGVQLARIIESRFPIQESLREALEGQSPDTPTWKFLATLSNRIQDALKPCIDRHGQRQAEREDRLRLLQSMTLRELFQFARTTEHPIPRELVQAKVRPEDLSYLQDEVVRWESRASAWAALNGLESIASAELLDWVVETMLNHPASTRHTQFRYERILLKLPAPVLLPLGRKHWNNPDPRLDQLSQWILAEHADPSDLPLLRARLPLLLENECENHYAICHVTQAMGRCAGAGPIPELRSALERVEHSCTRWFIVPALRRTDPEGFLEHNATECLWDCEPQVREEAMEAAALDAPRVADRLAVLAADPFEDPEVRTLASKRMDRTAD